MKNATAYDERARSMAGTNIFSIMNKKISEKNNDGVSPVIATIILVAITVIMCGLFAAFVMPFINELDEHPNEIIQIQSIKVGDRNITVKNIGRDLLVNSDYKPEFYINGKLLIIKNPPCENLTARAYKAGTVGLNSISGDGPNGDVWLPGAIGYFRLTGSAFKDGDVVRVDIIRKSDGKLFSRSEG
ncbi:MAG TPA: type IV pilin N-terminal domain-containing protein [Methanocorpusculum sp.]|nr:type IV pilin N-terminal domain-containing protein [Methanocorpusculum sp.]